MDSLNSLELQAFAEQFVESTRALVYIRREDGLIILRPNRLHHLNETALMMLELLYSQETVDVAAVVDEVCRRYGAEAERVCRDLNNLLYSVSQLLSNSVCGLPSVKTTRFGSHHRELPVLSEIALTYRCQNRCTFCYADAPKRGRDVGEMTTAEVKRIIDVIADDAQCPTLSFTGGEPTLRDDLAELITYARDKGLRVNLITNGVRCGEREYAAMLAAAGLDSAQVSIEGGSAEVHDAITQHPGSWAAATRAVHNLRAEKVHTHTNTTVCGGNREHLLALVEYIADELRSEYFSMNMVIRTGTALDHPEDDISYTAIGDVIRAVQARADAKGVHFVWYSPVPYCLFNPVQAGLGSKSCACVDGLISVNPAGELLPCSSFERGIGSLLDKPFSEVWHSRAARYWRNKEFLPPACVSCDIHDICCGACPLYWAQRGGFQELEGVAPGGRPWSYLTWRLRRDLKSGTFGVGLGRSHSREASSG